MTIPLWGNYLDRVHIVEFRSRHSWWFATSQLALWYGALTGSLLWVGVSRVVLGLARGGGMIAWQLGHNDFADQERVGVYMGIHVTLTGLRGVFARPSSENERIQQGVGPKPVSAVDADACGLARRVQARQ